MFLAFFNVQSLQEFAPTRDEAVNGSSDFNNAKLKDQINRVGSYYREQSGPKRHPPISPPPKDLVQYSQAPKPHPPISPPPKDLVQYSQGSNEYAKRRRHYAKVGIATPSDYTEQIQEYLKAAGYNTP